MEPVMLADYNLPADGIGAGWHTDTTLILPCDGPTIVTWFREAKAIKEEQGVHPYTSPGVINVNFSCTVIHENLTFITPGEVYVGCHIFPN